MASLIDLSADSPPSYFDVLPMSHAPKADDHTMGSLVRTQEERIPQTDIGHTVQVENSRLLSLPKELRLEIWKHTLTEPNDGMLVLRIMRDTGGPNTSGKRFFNSLYKHPNTPEIKTYFESPPSSPIGVSLLRTNHLIYGEALPILYHSVWFHPYHLEGIFPLFLETLSAFAKANIRYIRLINSDLWRSTRKMFYWALTCAQIARLNDSRSIRQVEVHGILEGDEKYIKRAVLAPLLKIKAPVVFVDHDYDKSQMLLAEAAAEREARAELRRAATEADAADAAERRKIADLQTFERKYPAKKRQKLQQLPIRGKAEIPMFSPSIDKQELARDLAEVPGIEDLDKELAEWDMMSVGSRSPGLSRCPTNVTNDDAWADNAPTILDIEEADEPSDRDPDDWEILDISSF